MHASHDAVCPTMDIPLSQAYSYRSSGDADRGTRSRSGGTVIYFLQCEFMNSDQTTPKTESMFLIVLSLESANLQ